VEIHEQLREILKRGCASLRDQVETVGRLLPQIATSADDAAVTIAEAQAITHQIKGTSGTIGFKDLAAAAAALDDSLKQLGERPMRVDQNQLQISNQLFTRLQTIARETTCENSALYDVDVSTLAGGRSI
jgi:HPt (histidine-containing phosphotransfer) domain-containing protein